MALSTYEKTMQRALRLLTFRPRTVAEMRERLREKEWATPAAVEEVIARLIELNYLNDAEYAIGFATSRLRMKPLGRTRLRLDLRRRHLPAEAVESAIDEAYAERPEEELIGEAIRKRIRLRGTPQSPEEKKKLADWLLRRGFSHDLVRKYVNLSVNPED